MLNATLWCKIDTITIERLVDFVILLSQFRSDLGNEVLWVMDYQTYIVVVGVVSGLFWLIIFFCCLGPLLVWCGWARIDEDDDFDNAAYLRSLVSSKEYMTRHQQIRKRRRRNESI